MTQLSERRARVPRSSSSENPFGCLGCLASTALLMVLSGAIVWALNPGMTPSDAARQGILVGGGLSILGTVLACGIPLLLICAALIFVLWKRRTAPKKGPTIIDIDTN